MGLVLSCFVMGFFLLFGTRIAPAFTEMFANPRARIPTLAVWSVRPSTSFICFALMLAGVIFGSRRPRERFIILPLVAAAGFVAAMVMFGAFFLHMINAVDVPE
jgi:hypothetical protein